MHSGSYASGHYYLYVFDHVNRHFIKFNDEKVSIVSIQDTMNDTIGNVNPHAHSAGLFYIRSDADFSDPFDDQKNLHFSDDQKNLKKLTTG